MWLKNKVTVAVVPSVSVHTLVDLEQERTFTHAHGGRMRVSLPNTFQGYGAKGAPTTGRAVPKRSGKGTRFRTKGRPFSYSL